MFRKNEGAHIMQVQNSLPQNQITQTFKAMASDGKVSREEVQELRSMIQNLPVSDQKKNALNNFVNKVQSLTSAETHDDGRLNFNEFTELKSIAQDIGSDLADQFLNAFESHISQQEESSFLRGMFKSIGSFFSGIFGASKGNESSASQNLTESMSSAPFSPTENGLSFPAQSSAVQASSAAQQTQASELCRSGHVCQAQGPRAESQANCGPAAAAMIMNQMGITPPSSLTDLREMVGAPTASNPHRGNRLAINEQELMNAVKKQGATQGKPVQAERKMLSSNPRQALNEMKERLARGEKVVLLTGNMHTSSTGHYVVVKQINPDGSLIIDDPGRAAPAGVNRHCSFEQFQRALSRRGNASMMCFS